jgi:hypothetical protein
VARTAERDVSGRWKSEVPEKLRARFLSRDGHRFFGDVRREIFFAPNDFFFAPNEIFSVRRNFPCLGGFLVLAGGTPFREAY